MDLAGLDMMQALVRYRFSEFTLSPQRRQLVRSGREVPLIPRYFDLLVLLIERRREAVHRRDIFDRVWADVIVSDSALSQAVRTIRSALGDDSKDPRFIRTVSRHGYQFVFPDVVELEDVGDEQTPKADAAPIAPAPAPPALASAIANEPSIYGDDDEVAETRAVRLHRAARLAATRWSGASIGAALIGIATGGVGGLILTVAPGSTAPIAIAPVLALVGGTCGAIGGCGVGAGLVFAEAAARAQRALELIVAASLGGGLVGVTVQWLARWSLASLVGVHLDVGGGIEGLVIGAGAGLGFALATRNTRDGLAAPRGRQRWQAALITAAICGLAGLGLTLAGRPLAAGTINAIAHAADGSRATLAPLGRLIGEPDFGPVSGAIFGFAEGALFGLGLSYGLMRRPRVPAEPASRASAHGNLT